MSSAHHRAGRGDPDDALANPRHPRHRPSSASPSGSSSGPGASPGRPSRPPSGRARFLFYAVWLIPAVLAPLIVRKPGAALFAEMLAAAVSTLIGSQWGPDTLLSGFVQGAAAELVFAFTLYRVWSFPVLAIAALASAAAAWVHDWVLYYPRSSWRRCSSFGVADGRLGGRHRRRAARSSSSGRSARPACSRASRAAPPERARAAGSPDRVAGPRSPVSSPATSRITYPGRAEPAVAGVSFDLAAGRLPPDRRAVGLGQEHAGPGDRRARAVGGRRRASTASCSLDGLRVGTAIPPALAARVGVVFQDPASQLVMERVEDDVAFGLESRGWPRAGDARPRAGGARRGRPRRVRAAPDGAPLGRRAAAPRARRGVRAAARPPRPRRADGEPRPGRRPRLRRAAGRAPRGAGDDDRPRRASGRPRLAARRPGPRPRRRRDAARPRHAGRGPGRGTARRWPRPASGCPTSRCRSLPGSASAGQRRAAPRSRSGPAASPPLAEARGVGFAFERGRPRPGAASTCDRAGRPGRAPRPERQRQVDRWPASSWASCGPTAGTVRLAGRDPARTSRPRARAPGRLRHPGPGAVVPRRDRARPSSSSASTPDERTRAARTSPPRSGCRSTGSATATRSPCRAASSAGSRWPASSSGGRGSSCSTSRRSARTAAATRASSPSSGTGSRPGRPSSRPPTTSASRPTWPARVVRLAAGRIAERSRA